MSSIRISPDGSPAGEFIPAQYLPRGKDQYYLRDAQNPDSGKNKWKSLTSAQIKLLEKNGCRADSWKNVLVAEGFDAELVRNTGFYGLVRIGKIDRAVLEFEGLKLSAGISDSMIISCDIGDNCAVHNVRYLAHYIIADMVMLFNVGEMHTENNAAFGNGIVKDGEDDEKCISINVMNEAGGRGISPFDGIIPADAYLWACFRDDAALQKKLAAITRHKLYFRRGFYGTVGSKSVIKNTRLVKDVKIGESCCISGTGSLRNLTVNSSEQEPSRIGDGVELACGIVGCGCQVLSGSKAFRFVLNNNSVLKLGVRLIDSFVGANSTIACCEVLNSLIFPAHEQHHNNSFLIASLVMGQSNVAAGVTIGSNHNSRVNDGEVAAGRGFWPGLCTSIKHSGKFASFVLLARGSYPNEMNIPFPFSLVNNNESRDRLEIMPAYWWMYNMYALIRNSAKFRSRDMRLDKREHIEYDALAPDTVGEIIRALELLADSDLPEMQMDNLEKGSRPVAVLKAGKAVKAYRDMLLYYSISNILDYCEGNPGDGFDDIAAVLAGKVYNKWINLGGQPVPEKAVDILRSDIESSRLDGWDAIHGRYDELWQAYPLQKQQHAWHVLDFLCGSNGISQAGFHELLDKFIEVQDYVAAQVLFTREKDFSDPFRKAVYRNNTEMEAVCGSVEKNIFIKEIQEQTTVNNARAKKLKKRFS